MMSMDNTPGFSGKTPDGCTTRGGNYWTLFTPGIWKDLHAVLHLGPDGAGGHAPSAVPVVAWSPKQVVELASHLLDAEIDGTETIFAWLAF